MYVSPRNGQDEVQLPVPFFPFGLFDLPDRELEYLFLQAFVDGLLLLANDINRELSSCTAGNIWLLHSA